MTRNQFLLFVFNPSLMCTVSLPNWSHYLILAYTFLSSLKVLNNEKRGGLKVVSFDRSPFTLFSLRFSNKSVQAKTAPRPCFYYLQTIIVSKYRHRVGLRQTFHIIHWQQRYCTSSPIFKMTAGSAHHHKSFQITQKFLAIFGVSAKNQ
jgi:hypothetical protein